MRTRIDETFQRLRDQGKKAFIAYVTAGDPNKTGTAEVLEALVQAGVDVIELGVPFSDPLADGIVNQMAAQRALEAGANVPQVLEIVREFRKKHSTPIVLFTYLNPIYCYGFQEFHREATEAGIDGMLLLDLPPDEAPHHEELAKHGGIQHIRLISPTSTPERIASIAAQSEGFVYYVSREGVTGEQQSLATSIDEQLALIRQNTKLPIAVGFGISNPEQAGQVAKVADGVVVGSAIVRKIGEIGAQSDLGEKVHALVKPLVDAVKSV